MKTSLRLPPLPTLETMLLQSLTRTIATSLLGRRHPRYNPCNPVEAILPQEYGYALSQLRYLFSIHTDLAFRHHAGRVIRKELAHVKRNYQHLA